MKCPINDPKLSQIEHRFIVKTKIILSEKWCLGMFVDNKITRTQKKFCQQGICKDKVMVPSFSNTLIMAVEVVVKKGFHYCFLQQ